MNDPAADPLREELHALRARVASLERQLAQRSADAGERATRALRLLEQIPAVMWSLDRDLRLTWWVGGSRSDMVDDPERQIGTDVYAFFETADPRHPAVEGNRRALRGESVAYTATLPRGQVFYAHVEPLRDAEGRIDGVIGVGLDVSDRARLSAALGEALDRVRTLSGMIPICMHCKSVRDDDGFWQNVETYVREHSHAEFSHGICPACMDRLLPATGTDER